jgi:hypothetical protein
MHDIVSAVSHHTREPNRDPAVQAWTKVLDAGVDDVAYGAAIVEFENALPTTPRGLILKWKLFWQRTRPLLQGDRLTASGGRMMSAFRKRLGTRAALPPDPTR